MQIAQWSENAALHWWDQPLLRKHVKTNNKINQQKQQTLITSKILYSFKKKQKLKIASDKTETKQNNLFFTRKEMVQLYKKAR